MTDREKFIKVLNDALTAKKNYPWEKAEMSFEFIEMLLKLMKSQPEIVRCKDCKKHGTYDCHITSLTGQTSADDWFCADGERK